MSSELTKSFEAGPASEAFVLFPVSLGRFLMVGNESSSVPGTRGSVLTGGKKLCWNRETKHGMEGPEGSQLHPLPPQWVSPLFK